MAEAAKVIENIQRDVNIALVNELALIFDKLGIATSSVLEAAATKWNFLSFHPGLVGGHCIGVDPYYLTYKATMIGHIPEMILAGRRINDFMSQHVGDRVIKLMIGKGINLVNARVLVMGLTFKANCPDMRNSKVLDLIKYLCSFGCIVDAHDPVASISEEVLQFDGEFIAEPEAQSYDAIVLAVGHDEFRDKGIAKIRQLGKQTHIVFDVMSLFARETVDGGL